MKDRKNKKPFKDTLVGSSLIGLASVINPGLGKVLGGALSVGDAIKMIGGSSATAEQKVMLQEFAIRQFEAEVADRASARDREAIVAAAGGSDVLFKTVGWGITLCFVAVILSAVFNWVPEENQRMFDMAFGAVIAAFTQVIGYYFGSSMGSKQKTLMQTNMT